jgi:hypothetical protein
LRIEESKIFIFTTNIISVLMTGRIVIIVTSNNNVDARTCKFIRTSKLELYTHTHTHIHTTHLPQIAYILTVTYNHI